jgi:hypothetical protein
MLGAFFAGAAGAIGATLVGMTRPKEASANTGIYSDTQGGPVLSVMNAGNGTAVSALNTVASPISGSPGAVGESYNGIGVYGISLNDNLIMVACTAKTTPVASACTAPLAETAA